MKNVSKAKQRFNLTSHARMRVVLTAIICGAFGHAQALPFGEQVQAGNLSFERGAQSLNINQTSQKAIVNWQSFSIASNETVRLNQPAQGVALFRVVGSDSSQIFGSLSATGSLFLSNPNGVLFGRSAQVDVGSIVATSMRISNDDFLAGRYQFYGDDNAGVSNQGVIRTADGGYIALLGNTVENSGTLQANNGSVILGSAQSAMLDFYGDGLVRVKLDGDALNAVIKQTGNIIADGGAVQLATNARSAAINVDGIIQANSLVERNGVIRLEGGKNARVSVSGTLSAAGNETGTTGGHIEVTGEQVALFKGAKLDASGDAGGGIALVGGDYQGKNMQVYNSRTVYVDKDAGINVDATNNGNGGKAVVWADNTTRFYGNISARGGAQSGNGGFVEVSGKINLDFIGGVDVGANVGLGGKVLLDPQDILLNTTVQTAPPNNGAGVPDVAFADPPAAGTTTIQISDITGYSELFLQATRDITVASAITMAVNNSIRLEANNNINLNANTAVSGTGSINYKADADNSGVGNLAIGGNITSRAGGITLSGATITRTAGNIASTGSNNADAGNITITSTGTTNLGAATITANGGTATGVNVGRSGGVITINAAGFTTTGAITASGSNGVGANQAGGNAGAITISTNTGNIATGALTARTGAGLGTGVNSTQGFITVNNTSAVGSITTGAINTSGQANGNGGSVTLTSLGTTTAGTITTSGGASTGTRAGRTAGNVGVMGATVTTGAITASGGAGIGANQNGGAGGAVTLTSGAGSNVTHTSITTSGGARTGTGTGGNGGNVNVNGNSLLSANTTITATGAVGGGVSGAVNFGGTINSLGASRALTINTTAATTLTGAIGNTLALTSITTNAGGTTTISGGSVTTTGAQTYNDNVTLGAATTLTTTNSNITFTTASSALNATGNNLIIFAGTGAVSAANAANNFANLAITAGSANIRDTNAIVLGATNVTGAYTLQTNGAITQTAAVTVGGLTTLTAGAANDITLSNVANNFNSVGVTSGRDVNLLDANALTVNASIVRTMTARILSNNLTLGGNIAASGTGDAIVLASAGNFINASNSSLTPGTGRWLVYSTSPLLDTRGAGLLAAYDFKQYNTAFGGAIAGTGDGFIYTIAPTITTTLGGTATKTYDGATTAPIGSLTLGQSGAIDGDTVNLSALTSATYDDKNAGTGKTVTSNALSITSATNGAKQVFGYTLVSPNATGNVGTINQRAITVTAATDTKTYDGNTGSAGAATVTSGSIVAGDTGSFSQTFDSRNAGIGKTLTVAGTVTDGNGGGNYAVTYVDDNTGVINQLALTGAITANNKTYDGNNTATIATRSLTGVIGVDDVSYSGGTATFANKNAGTGKTVTGTGLGLSGVDAGNYTVNTTAVTTADIAKADITAVTGITANNKVYDATTVASLNTGAAAYTGMIGSDNLTVATATGAFVDQNAGVGKTVNVSGLSLGDTDAGNYNLTTTTASTTADISQRAISVTANPGQSKTFGAADPLPFTFTVGGLGLVGGDTLAGALDRVAGEVVGSYAINQGSLAASSNYVLSYFGNNFNILVPSTTGGGSGDPRNAAGLVDLNPALGNYTNQQLYVLNVGATAAGVDSEGNQEACEGNPELLAKDKEFVLMLNYGLNLPKGINTSCDKASL